MSLWHFLRFYVVFVLVFVHCTILLVEVIPVIRAYYFWIPLICLICRKVARLKSKYFTAHSFTQYIDSKYLIEIELDDEKVFVRTDTLNRNKFSYFFWYGHKCVISGPLIWTSSNKEKCSQNIRSESPHLVFVKKLLTMSTFLNYKSIDRTNYLLSDDSFQWSHRQKGPILSQT